MGQSNSCDNIVIITQDGTGSPYYSRLFSEAAPIQLSGPPQHSNVEVLSWALIAFKIQSPNLTLALQIFSVNMHVSYCTSNLMSFCLFHNSFSIYGLTDANPDDYYHFDGV